MSKLANAAQFDVAIRNLTEKIVQGIFPHDYLSEYVAILCWIRTHIRYVRDPVTIEQVKTPRAVIETESADCIPYDTKIILRDKEGFYRVRSIGEIEFDYEDYEALSYNFERSEWEFKPITNWEMRGVRPVFNLTMNNGYSFRCTENHKLALWNQQKKEASILRLGEAHNGCFLKNKRTLLCAKQIPSLEKSFFDSGLETKSWISGAYVAEGWSRRSHVCIARSGPSQADLREALDSISVPFSVSKREKSAYLTILKSEFKDTLRLFGSRALNKHVPEDFLSGPQNQISRWIDGYAWGDSWMPDLGKKMVHRGHVAMHSTVSNELAEQIKLAYLILGRPLSGNLVENHGGLGKNPIWRLWESTGERYHERLPGLTNIGLKHVEECPEEPVYDITVEGNHNFVLSNGCLVHNCDEMGTLAAAMVGTIGGKSRFVAGSFNNSKPLSHVWAEAWDPGSKAWIILDPVPGRRVGQMVGRIVRTMVYPGVQ